MSSSSADERATTATHTDVDLEKQSSSVGPDADTELPVDSEKQAQLDGQEQDTSPKRTRKVRHQDSATRFAPIEPPRYVSADAGNPDAPRATRTFSRRERDLSHHESNHPFGGDFGRQHTENELVRFESQKGKDTIIVHWEGDNDPENPQTWSRVYRWYLTGVAGLMVLNSTFTSSAPSGIVPEMERAFGFGREVGTLTIAIFVAGYCVGPLLWGPLSEYLGRKPVFLIAMLAYTGFNVGCALSKNTASILVFRFLAGTFAASPLTNSGGVIADIWDAKTRGIALSIFSIAPFAGPALGPIVGGFIAVSGTDWRWLFWVCTMFSGFCLILLATTLPETYAPIILVRKAKRIRKETGDNRYKAPLELGRLPLKDLAHVTVAKPFIMLVQEPALLAFTVYLSFVYGVVYLLFEAFPIVFGVGHGFNAGVSGLMFIPFFLGGVAAVALYVFYYNPKYARTADELRAKGIMRVPPEERLYCIMVAGPVLVVAFFWFGWTSYPSISFWSPMMAGSLIGFGVLFCFLGTFNYLIDL